MCGVLTASHCTTFHPELPTSLSEQVEGVAEQRPTMSRLALLLSNQEKHRAIDSSLKCRQSGAAEAVPIFLAAADRTESVIPESTWSDMPGQSS